MDRMWRIFASLMVVAGIVVFGPISPAQAAGEVGSGSALSCSDTALNAALAGGGLVTFNCGSAPVTIVVATEKILLSSTQLDGGGLVTLSGGGTKRIFSVVVPGATLQLDNITLSDGVAGGANPGGAVFSAGPVIVSNSTFSANSAFSGGAIFTSNTLSVSDSTFDGNIATAGGGGAIMSAAGNATVTASTFANNHAFGGNGGGAISNLTGPANITNSTFTWNSASFGGALLNATGGATMNLTSSTVSDNSATTNGGGIYNSAGTTNVAASIVAENSATTGANCFDDATPGVVVSQGSNLSDDASCGFASAGDIQNSSNIDLNALADNGGLTQTMLPQASSDAVDNADCGLAPSEDQRGVDRPAGAGCDIGSVEVRLSTFVLCVNYYTGAVYSPPGGQCGAGQIQLDPTNQTFCLNPYTGQMLYRFGAACTPPQITHTLPDDGDLLTCVSYYTGLNRWVWSHSQCTAYEAPNTIPAMP